MMKKMLLVVGIALCYPPSYQPTLTNEVISVVEVDKISGFDNNEMDYQETPIEQKQSKKSSKGARARKVGRVIGFIVLTIITAAAAIVALIFGALAGHYIFWGL